MAQITFAIFCGRAHRIFANAPLTIAAGFILVAATPHLALAASAPCETPSAQAQLKLGYASGADEALHNTGAVAFHQTHASFASGPLRSGVRTRISHDYNIYDIDLDEGSAPPSGNGHYHRLALDADFSSLLSAGWQLRVQPALAVSSNQLRSPKRIRARGLQLNGAVLRHVVTGVDTGWTAGLCADQRFGDYRIYPSVSWHRSTNEWFVQLGWPDSRVTKQLTVKLNTSLQVFPGGNRWHVLGQEEGQHKYHWFSHETWQARWAVEWRPLPALGVELSTSFLFDNHISFKTETGGLFEGKTETPQLWELSLIWYLEQPFVKR